MKNVIQTLLTFILNALWQGTLIVACAAVGDWLLRGVAPRFRHYLWVVTLVACLVMPVLSCLPLITAGSVSAMAKVSGPIPVVTSRIITPGVEDLSRRPVNEDVPSFPRVPFSQTVPVPAWAAYGLIGLYALVLLWRTFGLLRAWRRTNRIVAGSFECEFKPWVDERISQIQNEIGVKSCRVLCSDEVAVPITVGVFDRIVILPRRFAGEVSAEVLSSALGHELQHVARRDYLLNLIYEFIYLPLAFHPAVAFARRRIKHTRELCCDAAVTTTLVPAEVYARSLVKLIGSAPLLPLAPDTTIGMNESDILEVRIIALLRKSNLSFRTRVLLIATAAVLMVTPCVAAARFAVNFNTSPQEPQLTANAELPRKTERAQLEKMVVALEAQAEQVKKTLAQTPSSKQDERAALEARLAELQRNLEEHRKALESSQLRSQEEAAQRLKQILEQYPANNPVDKAKIEEMLQAKTKSADDLELLRESLDKMAAEQAASQGDRKARMISHTEARYTDDARAKGIVGNVILRFTVDHDGIPQDIQIKKSLYPSLDQSAIEAVRTWRFEPAMKNGQVVSTWLEVQINFNLYDDPQKKEERETRERREQAWTTSPDGQEIRVRRGNEAERRAEREAGQKRDAILASLAKISMDHAIQIATSTVPGKVIECSLVGERWDGPAELAKPTMVLYHVVVLSDEATPVKNHVLINAMDGSIVSVKQEDRREEEAAAAGDAAYTSDGVMARAINGGVLNSKATNLPAPAYPAIARAAHASGDVTVRVMVDLGGNIVEATPISGHPLLRAAAQAAAKEAKFTPTRVSGAPVMVTGLLVYNFVAQ